MPRVDRLPPDSDSSEDRPANLLTVTEAARRTDLSRSTISAWITQDRLPSVLIDGRRHVRLADLVATRQNAHLGEVIPAWRQDQRHAGRRLRMLREAAGLSQLELAATSGITHEVISNLEQGKRSPLVTTVNALAHALAIDPERFVSHESVGLTMLTTAEAASWLEVPPARVQIWSKAGELAGVKVSGQWRVPAVAVAELARSGRLRGRSRRLDPRYHG